MQILHGFTYTFNLLFILFHKKKIQDDLNILGECGHQPAVRVWDLQSDPQPGPPGVAPQVQQVAEFLSHKYGISCVVRNIKQYCS